MKLWARFKYSLLRLLMDDICRRSECTNCGMCRIARFSCGSDPMSLLEGPSCHEEDIFGQARKAWNLEG